MTSSTTRARATLVSVVGCGARSGAAAHRPALRPPHHRRCRGRPRAGWWSRRRRDRHNQRRRRRRRSPTTTDSGPPHRLERGCAASRQAASSSARACRRRAACGARRGCVGSRAGGAASYKYRGARPRGASPPWPFCGVVLRGGRRERGARAFEVGDRVARVRARLDRGVPLALVEVLHDDEALLLLLLLLLQGRRRRRRVSPAHLRA
mmetsp:Transcript_5037/g.20664  ORF Transcript_5037/g.20664 Transcript_5037/m.20664 type:complete len:208 (+) Transcript_5037:878-1501(+)